MLFNSLDFLIFVVVVFLLYWSLNHFGKTAQNLFILLSSYLFYGWWDWRFLILIAASTVIDFLVGNQIKSANSKRKKKQWLYLSVLTNLGLLGFFKYFNFFITSFVDLFDVFGVQLHQNTLNIILPVGISFYTFQTLSYTIDVYRKELEPTRNLLSFATYVSFFPQLVAGPIERAKNLLVQFETKRSFNYDFAKGGLRLILWGFFKKIVIADNCGEIVDLIYLDPDAYNARTLLIGAIFFAFQVYGDFSGYSDIAIGIGRLFGINLSYNFRYPFFARNQIDLWQRWHISLMDWFRVYVYKPLTQKRQSKAITIRNIGIVFILSGLWHGANYTYIIWGAYFGVAYIIDRMLILKALKLIKTKNTLFLSSVAVAGVFKTFIVFVFGLIIFRSPSITASINFISSIFSKTLLNFIDHRINEKVYTSMIMILFMLIVEFIGRKDNHALESLAKTWPRIFRWSFYSFIMGAMFLFMNTNSEPFFYFQF